MGNLEDDDVGRGDADRGDDASDMPKEQVLWNQDKLGDDSRHLILWKLKLVEGFPAKINTSQGKTPKIKPVQLMLIPEDYKTLVWGQDLKSSVNLQKVEKYRKGPAEGQGLWLFLDFRKGPSVCLVLRSKGERNAMFRAFNLYAEEIKGTDGMFLDPATGMMKQWRTSSFANGSKELALLTQSTAY